MITKKDLVRVAEGFRYVANDPATDFGTVQKMVNEFCNAMLSINPRFDANIFKSAVYRSYASETWKDV